MVLFCYQWDVDNDIYTNTSPEDLDAKIDLINALERLRKIDIKSYLSFIMYHGFSIYKPMTYEEVGELLGLGHNVATWKESRASRILESILLGQNEETLSKVKINFRDIYKKDIEYFEYDIDENYKPHTLVKKIILV